MKEAMYRIKEEGDEDKYPGNYYTRREDERKVKQKGN